ncbi:MAG: tRNA (N6-threonylcarbamoyladenosine(37)-N6)-methyltransferase TrmO [Chloroflexi bacterium]|jgi:tRNA (adenine37-N6)-methyltransferase|nr:tRNA (N6-threonylcarbamoyladenosine(37)-N6)-methyltransferase TrmO [Chloroflexota bacterium]MBT7081631.1 tRNA (N6-threonylcarbamoyladenosine(37)-N6)-methyltransferase TrmO [Chloroflexota bacterium]MBT7288961.1 tRNA (N6-threonylcarbamoyladenosine(37)-N6)-methyltransferase TrmO [Chloroflexota bacterium]
MTEEKDISIDIEPIGYVDNPEFVAGAASGEKRKDAGWKNIDANIILKDDYADGLDDIQQHQRLIIVFWAHNSKSDSKLDRVKIHPQGKQDIPLTGIFSTSSPSRPNSVLVTVVKFVKHEGNVLTVKGLDALSGSPVIDIKPYDPEYHIGGK